MGRLRHERSENMKWGETAAAARGGEGCGGGGACV